MTETKCMSCSLWFDKKLRACPDCGCPIGSANPTLYRAKLDNHIYGQVEAQRKEVHDYHAVRTGAKPPADWARARAVEILDTL